MLHLIILDIMKEKIDYLEQKEKSEGLTEDETLILGEYKREYVIISKIAVIPIDFTGSFEEFEKRFEDKGFYLLNETDIKNLKLGNKIRNMILSDDIKEYI